MSLVDRIGSMTTPGAVGSRYGRFCVLTPVAATATGTQIATTTAPDSTAARKLFPFMTLPRENVRARSYRAAGRRRGDAPPSAPAFGLERWGRGRRDVRR